MHCPLLALVFALQNEWLNARFSKILEYDYNNKYSWSKTGKKGMSKPQTSMYLSDEIPLFYILY